MYQKEIDELIQWIMDVQAIPHYEQPNFTRELKECLGLASKIDTWVQRGFEPMEVIETFKANFLKAKQQKDEINKALQEELTALGVSTEA